MSETRAAGAPFDSHALLRTAISALSWLGVSGIVTVLAGLLLVPILARMYPPAAWGQFAVFQVGAGMLALVLTGRLELGLPLLARTEQQVLHRFLDQTVLGLMSGLAMLAWLAHGYGNAPAVAVSIPIGAGLTALISVLSLRMTACARFGQLALLEGATAIIPPIFQVLFAIGSIGADVPPALGLILGQMLGLAAVFAAGHLWIVGRSTIERQPTPPLPPILHRLRAYPTKSLPASIIVTGRERLLIFAAMAILPPAAVGQLAMAIRLATLPATLVGNAVRPVLFGLAGQSGLSRARQLARWYLIGIIPLVGLTCGAFSALAKPILQIFLGPSWDLTANAFAVLILIVPARAAAAGLSRLFDLAGRQKAAALLEVGFAFALVTTLAATIAFGPIAWHLYVAAAVVSGVYFQIYALQAWRSVDPALLVPVCATLATVCAAVAGNWAAGLVWRSIVP